MAKTTKATKKPTQTKQSTGGASPEAPDHDAADHSVDADAAGDAVDEAADKAADEAAADSEPLGMDADAPADASDSDAGDADKSPDSHEHGAVRHGAVRKSTPYCKRHNCEMVCNGTRPDKRHYRCKVKSCDQTAVMARERTVVPKQPLLCPKCLRWDRGEQACEVNYERSGSYSLRLECPECDYAVSVARPDMHYRRRARASRPLLER